MQTKGRPLVCRLADFWVALVTEINLALFLSLGDEVKRMKLPAHLDKLTICLGGNTAGTFFVSKQMLALLGKLLPQESGCQIL